MNKVCGLQCSTLIHVIKSLTKDAEFIRRIFGFVVLTKIMSVLESSSFLANNTFI